FFSVFKVNIFVLVFPTGLESAKSENYEEAFCCFLASAQHGYNKAQFNTGVCFEKGRGVIKDKEKVGPLLFFMILADFDAIKIKNNNCS
ncbi:hypothetical protein XENOCAPTIV_000454, partial [Xenoophorus captivus]